MIEFNHVHARYWRDQRGNPDAAIPVKGRDIVEREGRTYAVLFDADAPWSPFTSSQEQSSG